jgi:hypothetical protein
MDRDSPPQIIGMVAKRERLGPRTVIVSGLLLQLLGFVLIGPCPLLKLDGLGMGQMVAALVIFGIGESMSMTPVMDDMMCALAPPSTRRRATAAPPRHRPAVARPPRHRRATAPPRVCRIVCPRTAKSCTRRRRVQALVWRVRR